MKKIPLFFPIAIFFPLASYAAQSAAPHKENYLTPSQIEELRQELLKKPETENTIIPYGYIQADMNVLDTERTNTPDFQGQHAILGILVKGGIVSGQVGFDLFGNQNPYTSQKTDVQGLSDTSGSSNNTVQLRRAQLNIDVWHLVDVDNIMTTTVSIGGIRVGSALDSAPDAANVPSGFSRQDGIYIQQKMLFGSTWDMKLGLGVFNVLYGTMPGRGSTYAGWGSNGISMQNPWMSSSLNPSLAYLGSFNAIYHMDKDRDLNFLFFHGFQNNAPYSTMANTGVGGVTQSSGSLSEARNINHTEASLLYQDDTLFGTHGVITPSGLSVWYEREQNARTMLVSGNLSSGYSYMQGPVDDAQLACLYGIGVGLDTQNKLSNLLQKKDRLTASAAYTVVTSTLGSPSLQQEYVVNQISGSVGYAVNTFEMALNAEWSTANNSILFTDANGNSKNNETKSYITAVYSF